ncbi:MAG: glycosyltransferase family 2 protein [Leptolyngbyaceae bacterium]|nr:glycosyltransferase family 2 protein [Leptolyngbyaceae bacterium]
MKITLLIPTYRRPQDLMRCLKAIENQDRLPDEIVVVVRDTDTETQESLKESFKHDLSTIGSTPVCETTMGGTISLKVVTVYTYGVVAALNAGLEKVTGDIVTITDDDTVPHSHWLSRIEQHFLKDPKVGGVGGRDWLYFGDILQSGEALSVGRLRWFGARTGNHHLGIGKARSVEILKGANMSFRREAIGTRKFDERFKGTGAQVHFEMAFSLNVKKAGWTLIYDPEVSIDHLAGPRFDEDQRHQFNALAFTNAVHNETLALLDYLPFVNRIFFGMWSILVGNRDAFGLVQLIRFFPTEGKIAWQKWRCSLNGRWQGYRTWAQH